MSGYAWSRTIGWISFNLDNEPAYIDVDTGYFEGYAWSPKAGWIHFRNQTAPVTYQVRAIEAVPTEFASTGLDLNLDSTVIFPNSPLDIYGRLIRFPNAGISLSDLEIQLIITFPNQDSVTQVTTTTDNGKYVFTNLPPLNNTFAKNI